MVGVRVTVRDRDRVRVRIRVRLGIAGIVRRIHAYSPELTKKRACGDMSTWFRVRFRFRFRFRVRTLGLCSRQS